LVCGCNLTARRVEGTLRGSPIYLEFNSNTLLSVHNLSMKPNQMGVTLNLIYLPTNKLQIRPFATWQKTEIKNFAKTIDTQDITETVENEWTPDFYYSMVINYVASEKLNYNFNFYGFSQSKFSYYGGYKQQSTIRDLILLNMKVSYKVADNFSVYLNVRNFNLTSQITNDKLKPKSDQQFGFTDNIKTLLLFGLNFDL